MRSGFSERVRIGLIVALAMGLASLIMLIVLPLVGVILSVTMVMVAVLLLALAVGLPFVILLGGRSVKGSGHERQEIRDVPPFREVHVAGALHTEIVLNDSHSVSVLGDDNLLEHVQTNVDNGVLHIRTGRRLRSSAGIKVHVSAHDLNAIVTSGATKTSVTGIESNRIRVETSGVSKTTLAGQSRDAALALSGAGKLDARDLDCDNVEMTISGAGKATVYAKSNLIARISGAGKIDCYGNPDNVTKDVSGAGKIELK